MDQFIEYLVNLFTHTNTDDWSFVSKRPGKNENYYISTYRDNIRNRNVCLVVHTVNDQIYTWFLENDVIHFGLNDFGDLMVTFATKSLLDELESDQDIDEPENGIEEILLEFGMPKEFFRSETMEGYYYIESFEKTKTYLESLGFVHDTKLVEEDIFRV